MEPTQQNALSRGTDTRYPRLGGWSNEL